MLRWRYLKSSFGWWFGLIWATVGTIFAVVALVFFSHQRDLSLNGATAAATVVEKGHESDKDGDSKHWIRFVFHDTSGTEHVDTADIGWEAWRALKDGDSITVRYLPDNPQSMRVEGIKTEPPWVLPVVFGLVGSVFGGIGWLLVVKSVLRSGRQAALIAGGVGSLGTVTAVELNRQVTINRRHPTYFEYEFVDDAGTLRRGRSPDLPMRLSDRWNVGDRVLVLSDVLDPERFEVDLFEYRAEELAMLLGREPAVGQ